MSMNQPRKVAILGGNRIPFARSNKEYANASNQDMLTSALNGLVARYGLQDKELGLVVGGAVLKHARDFNLVRESVLGSELASTTPAFDVQHACGTSLTSAIQVADAIALGRIENGIACGADTTSDAPLAVNDTLRKTLIRLSTAKSAKDQLKLVGSIRPNQLAPEQPQNGEPRTGLSMGEHAAITAREMEITREAQDELAATSHQNLAKAYDEGFFNDLMTPFLGVNRDTNLRPDSSVEKLAKLKPVFGKKDAEQHGGTATMTAGNSTPLTDGAAAVLLGSEEWAKEQNLPVQAYIVDSELAAVDFVSGKDGLLMAPTYAVPRLLERNGLTLQDFDFYEIHEAFASQVLATLKAWEDETYCRERLGLDAPLGSIDRSKLNVKGSSLAAGHPFAATGARILASAAKTLEQNGGGRTLISICAAGGQGVVAIIER
ncbi:MULTISPECIES: acetyl-CoA C-acetyltransferase [unclassified Corynebacterium]|uniref:acetyl-CoA C-acetyltransferase n=2 Tax=unclassified Corynebacterium TaxID=2624378 RepID=UPI0021AA9F32|nr:MULTISPECIES: acetyl-CoA C-acetyltransferase [unclassified Corynebacterium]MCT1451543.1 acetyl-CoA C-acetyltransferase [Corynebacterium sp. p3-SID1145]MCT1460450.1 acetyl-CoA C-acetyltransferase [Corynebacterium sp. p3-SID1140]MDN8593564.1 acetyl-CoA C-acetyltransferase [Corynebacterium sp. P4_F2]WKK56644.1 acetyl-CoA C-acetyltransferase [Corynebacterium sp. P4-C1]WKK64424.1 acetyl-CoA C-acetyltransferase [Corynebacterium sp. P8-C1]